MTSEIKRTRAERPACVLLHGCVLWYLVDMKLIQGVAVLAMSLMMQGVASGAEVAPPRQTREAFLELKAPIARWDEGIPIGNGLMGALLWGGGQNTLNVSLDRADLWDTRTPNAFLSPDFRYKRMIEWKKAGDHASHVKLFDVPYDTIAYPTKLPAGRLVLTLAPELSISDIRLNLATGDALIWQTSPFAGGASASSGITTTFDRARAVLVLTGFTAKPEMQLIAPGGVSKLEYPIAESGSDESSVWFLQKTINDGSYAVVATYMKAAPLHKGQPIRQSIAIAIVTSEELRDDKSSRWPGIGPREPQDPLSEARKRALAAADVYRSDVIPAHRGHIDGFMTSSVRVPDAAIQKQYDLCTHLYLAGSRPDGPPLALQGVWTADEGGLPPWKGDYHHDLNTQMTYLAYHAAGLTDSGMSFINQLNQLRPRFRRFAREFYDAPGLVVPGVMGIDGAPLGGWGQYSLSPMHTAWLAQTFYLHWKYTGDHLFAREVAYPWCHEALIAIESLLIEGADGKMRLPLSTSPEIYDNSPKAWLTPNSNYDQSLLMFLYEAVAELSDASLRNYAFNKSRPDHNYPEPADTFRARAAKLGALDIDPQTHALTFAKGEPYAQSHRHFSHAMAIHPLGILNIEGSDADRATINATLDQLEQVGTKQWVGYSFSWYSAMCARAGRADQALKYLELFTKSFTSRNGFHLNGDQSGKGLSDFTYRPFTLEGNFLAMHAVHEMLLQSWGGRVRIFPAVSAKWADVSFTDLRAEGGYRISARRVGGETREVSISATREGTLRLRKPFATEGTWNMKYRSEGSDLLFDLVPGDQVRGGV